MNDKNDQLFTFPNTSQHVQGSSVKKRVSSISIASKVNYASLSGKMGAPNAQISKAYSSPVTPAGFAFSPLSCKNVCILRAQMSCSISCFAWVVGFLLVFAYPVSNPNHMLVFWPQICIHLQWCGQMSICLGPASPGCCPSVWCWSWF